MPAEKDASAPRTPPSRATIIVLVVFAGLAAWGLLRKPSTDQTTAVDPAKILVPGSAKGFNLLFITLDTTRPDRLGCYGYAQAQTPTIDSLAARGVRFDDAVTSVPVTMPSHSVMMTGQYPPVMGVRDNGQQLAEEHVTLAEILSSNGYRTAAFVGAFVLDARFGLAQGFSTYDFRTGDSGRLVADSLSHERSADLVTGSAVKWIREEASRSSRQPFFLWVHYFDPHYPYESPLATLPEYEGRPYDAEIGLVDLQIKHLLERLTELAPLESTLIVVATDHGEGFYEKGEAYHGIFLYESTLRSAIIFSNPQLFDRAYRVDDRLVGTVDLLPTLLELLGIPAPDGLNGRSMRLPAEPDRFVYIETEFPLANACAPLYGLRRHHDKYINAPRSEYYDLAKDPGELENLYSDADATVVALHDQLLALLAQWSGEEYARPSAELDAETMARLQSIGYIGASHREGLPDPKDHIHVINVMTEVLHLKHQKRFDEALKLLESIVEQSEGWDAPVFYQAEIYRELEQYDDMLRVLRVYAEQHRTGKSLFDYAKGLDVAGQWEECLRVVDEAIALEPKVGAAHMLRGDALMALQRYADAVAAYERAQEVDPERLSQQLIKRLREARSRMR